MKNFTIFSIIQVVIFTILAILASISFVLSVIQAGEFFGWQVGYGLLVVLAYFLVCESVKEAKKNANN